MSLCLFVCLSLSSMTLRSSFVLLLVISTTWLFGLLAVNNSVLAFHYLYTVLCSLQVTARPLPGEGLAQPRRALPSVESRVLVPPLSPLQQWVTLPFLTAVPMVSMA